MKAGLRESEDDCHGGWGAGTKTGSCGVKCVQRVSTKGHAGGKRKAGSEGAALTGDAEAADGAERGFEASPAFAQVSACGELSLPFHSARVSIRRF